MNSAGGRSHGLSSRARTRARMVSAVRSSGRVDGPTATSKPSIRDIFSSQGASTGRTFRRTGRAEPFPRAGVSSETRYGSETVVPSPVAEIVNVPAEVLPAYAYGGVQPAGVDGVYTMNG